MINSLKVGNIIKQIVEDIQEQNVDSKALSFEITDNDYNIVITVEVNKE